MIALWFFDCNSGENGTYNPLCYTKTTPAFEVIFTILSIKGLTKILIHV